MELQHYIFALFIFVLVCVAGLFYKYLFADVKRQNKLLDEKESKLLRLYQTLEEVMDEFHDTVTASKAEIDSALKKAEGELSRITGEAAAEAAEVQKAAPAKKAGSFLNPRPETISLIAGESDFEESMFSAILKETEENLPEAPRPNGKSMKILELHGRGLNHTEIAKELGITEAEVALVIGINKNI